MTTLAPHEGRRVVEVSWDGRDVTLFGLIPLLTFEKPEYEMDGQRGIVRWRIEKGILVAKAGRNGRGYLEMTGYTGRAMGEMLGRARP